MRLFPSILLISALSGVPYAYSQPHIHGETVPDWYDPSCCSNNDCRPVSDSDIEFGTNAAGVAVVIHKATGLEFAKDKWRTSQDERFHVCFRSAGIDESGYNQEAISYCVYLRPGV